MNRHIPNVVIQAPNSRPAPTVAPVQALGNEAGAKAMRKRIHGADTVKPPSPDIPVVEPMNVDDVVMEDNDAFVNENAAQSWVVKKPIYDFNLNSKKGKADMMTVLPSAVQLQLKQDFGKDDANHSFTNDATMRHAFLHLYFSDYLTDSDWHQLRRGMPVADRLGSIFDDYGQVDFRPLRDNFFPEGWEDATDFNEERSAQLTSCFLFYKGSAAAVVRYIGGPFVGAHRNVPEILNNIRGIVPDHIYDHVKRVYTVGAPVFCNDSSTDENLQTYSTYGNHATADKDVALLHKTLLKDEKRGHVMCLDPRLEEFVEHLHLCPIGLCDLEHKIKKPRFIYDASFHPTPTSQTCNDWTTKETEPDLEFPATFARFITWMWNMRISHPNEEIYPLDDDITAAFRSFCWHPSMVSMHGMKACNKLWLMVRLTFGDCSSPPNSEPVFIARREMAKHFFNMPDVVERAAKFMPKLTIIEPSLADIASIMRIPSDSHNPGVQRDVQRNHDADTPPYVHHVDDNLYGALRQRLLRAIAASILGLYSVMGDPVPTQPDPFSYEKFELTCNHLRKITGIMIDTRSMYLWLPQYKRDQIVDLLAEWLNKKDFLMLAGLELQGVLIDASRFNNWGRLRFFILQGVISKALRQRYHTLTRVCKQTEADVATKLAKYKVPPAVMKQLVRQGCDQVYAKYLYRSKDATTISERLHNELRTLHDYLADPTNPWRINIGHIIPRDYVSVNVGDASFFGVGFWSDQFRVICMIATCLSIRKRCYYGKDHAGRLSMNILEYVTSIFDYACSITILEHDTGATMREQLFPNGVPPMARILSSKDNRVSEAWIRKGATSAIQGQQLIRIMGALGNYSTTKQDGGHIKGTDNKAADMLSRPDKENGYRLDHAALLAHLDNTIATYPRFATYKVFMPSSNLFRAVAWALRPTDQVAATELTPPQLVQPFGRFMSIDEFRVSMEYLYDS